MISNALRIKIAITLAAIASLLTMYFTIWKPQADRADQLVQMQLQQAKQQQDEQKRAAEAWKKAHATPNWHFGPGFGDPNK